MSFNFIPLTEEELNRSNLAEEGTYEFEVIRSYPEISSKGNRMAKLNIKFWDNYGTIHTLFDYLVFSEDKFSMRKIKHFCDSTNLSNLYEKGELPEELGGYSGKFIVSKQEGTEIPEHKLNGKPKGSKYSDKNIVVDYVKNETIINENKLDDDIEF